MNTFHITKPARADLRDIWNFAADRSESRADRLMDDIFDQFQAIADQPLLLGSKDIIYGTEYRISVIRNFVIFYQPIEAGVEIIRVVHGSRDPQSITF